MPSHRSRARSILLAPRSARDEAWRHVKPLIDAGEREPGRTRLAYILASFVMLALNENDLVDHTLRRYRARD